MDAAVSSYRGCATEHELRVEGAFNSARSIQEGWIKIPDCAGLERALWSAPQVLVSPNGLSHRGATTLEVVGLHGVKRISFGVQDRRSREPFAPRGMCREGDRRRRVNLPA